MQLKTSTPQKFLLAAAMIYLLARAFFLCFDWQNYALITSGESIESPQYATSYLAKKAWNRKLEKLSLYSYNTGLVKSIACLMLSFIFCLYSFPTAGYRFTLNAIPSPTGRITVSMEQIPSFCRSGQSYLHRISHCNSASGSDCRKRKTGIIFSTHG